MRIRTFLMGLSLFSMQNGVIPRRIFTFSRPFLWKTHFTAFSFSTPTASFLGGPTWPQGHPPGAIFDDFGSILGRFLLMKIGDSFVLALYENWRQLRPSNIAHKSYMKIGGSFVLALLLKKAL